MLSGAIEPDAGEIEVRGELAALTSPATARRLGIETAYQDLALCPNLGATYNLVLGNEIVRTHWGPFSIRDDRAAETYARARLADLGVTLDDYERPIRLLSGGQRQIVAIARVAGDGATVVILDEPTAALGVRQTANVLELVRNLRARGVAIIMVTHDVETVFAIADRIAVLRLGAVVFDGPAGTVTQRELVHLMAGLSPDRPLSPAIS
jgi:ABC-type sugar transport system ATPase subunit